MCIGDLFNRFLIKTEYKNVRHDINNEQLFIIGVTWAIEDSRDVSESIYHLYITHIVQLI